MDGEDRAGVSDGFQGADELVRGVIAFRRVPQAQGNPRRPLRKGSFQLFVDGGIILVVQAHLPEPGHAGPNGAAARQHEGVHGQGPGLERPVIISKAVHGDAGKVAGHRVQIGGDGRRVGPRLGGQG